MPDPTWHERIQRALDVSVRRAGEVITRAPEVQSWLQEAAYTASMHLTHPADLDAAAHAYGTMRADFEARFPEIVAAVREATGGCGRADLDWDALAPQYTKVVVRFGVDFPVDVCCRLAAVTPEAARAACRRVAAALPESAPFPGHPNERHGLLAFAGRCLGLRVRAAAGAATPAYALLAPGYAPATGLTLDEAVAGMRSFFTPDAG